MHKLVRKASRGFTLIELMIVVAIVGILAVLAIYGVRKYIANAKTAEARNSLGQMGKDQATEFESESMSGAIVNPGATVGSSRSLCKSPTGSVPAAIASVKGMKYVANPANGSDWNKDVATPLTGFACLKFAMDAPQYYMYNFVTANPTAAAGTWTATANGDLNGDGVLSTFSLAGKITTQMTFDVAPNLTENDPEE